MRFRHAKQLPFGKVREYTSIAPISTEIAIVPEWTLDKTGAIRTGGVASPSTIVQRLVRVKNKHNARRAIVRPQPAPYWYRHRGLNDPHEPKATSASLIKDTNQRLFVSTFGAAW